MKTKYLFSHRLKKVSGVIFLFSLIFIVLLYIDYNIFSKINPKSPVFAIIGNGELVFGTSSKTALFPTYYFSFIYNEILDEILFFILIVSGIIYAFSKEKTEDELISKIRLDSLAWSTYFNYGVILFCYLFFYGFPFLKIITISMFSNLLFFIVRFRWAIYKYNKDFDEK